MLSSNSVSPTIAETDAEIAKKLPAHRDLYYGGAWRKPQGGYTDTYNPATGANLGACAEANADDVNAAVAAANAAFPDWSATKPAERGRILHEMAERLRLHGPELAYLDAANCGNPIREMVGDASVAAAQLDFFAGLVTEIKGDTQLIDKSSFNMMVREPLGVCSRIVAYNHPLMFTAGKCAAPLAAGNTVIMKPPPQAPLATYRMMELFDGLLPPGVFNLLTGGVACGEALVEHPLVPMVTLIGSAPTGRAIAAVAAKHLKSVLFELGGKNALIVYPDANRSRAIEGAIRGMNFGWCGQSCGSTSRLFVHASIYDEILAGVVEGAKKYKPGIPTEMATTMGAIVSKAQHDKILSYIELGKTEGARLVLGGRQPAEAHLQKGFFVEPTVFADVRADMRIAREEIFGPVLSMIKWDDEEEMLSQVNSVEYGLTGAVFTESLATAHRVARRIQSGFIWINHSASHFLGSPFGGYKQSGLGREECLEELLSFTQIKNIHVSF
ncbi:MAG: aldehyde dehydrogenase family protein [Alphaproteobacteria bacterium]